MPFIVHLGGGDPRSFIVFALFAAITLFAAIFDFSFDDRTSSLLHRSAGGGDRFQDNMSRAKRMAPLLPHHRWQFVYRPMPVHGGNFDGGNAEEEGEEGDREVGRVGGGEHTVELYSISNRLFDSFVQYFFNGNASQSQTQQPTHESVDEKSDEEREKVQKVSPEIEKEETMSKELHHERKQWSPVPPWVLNQRTIPQLLQFERDNLRENGVWYFLTMADDVQSHGERHGSIFLTVVYPRLMDNETLRWNRALLEQYAFVDDNWQLFRNETIEGYVSLVSQSADGSCVSMSVVTHSEQTSGMEVPSLAIRGYCHVDQRNGWKPFQIRMKSSRQLTSLETTRSDSGRRLCIVTAQSGDNVEFRRSCLDLTTLESDDDAASTASPTVTFVDGPMPIGHPMLWDDIFALHSVRSDHIFGLKLSGSFNTDSRSKIKKDTLSRTGYEVPMLAISYKRIPRANVGDADADSPGQDDDRIFLWKQVRSFELLNLGKRLLYNSMGQSPFESILFGKQLMAKAPSAKLATVSTLQPLLVSFEFTDPSASPQVSIFDYSDYVESGESSLATQLDYLDYDTVSADFLARLFQQHIENAMSQAYAPRVVMSDMYQAVAIVRKSVIFLAMKDPTDATHTMRYRIELHKDEAKLDSSVLEHQQQADSAHAGESIMGSLFLPLSRRPEQRMDLERNLDIAAVSFEEHDVKHEFGDNKTLPKLYLLVMYADGSLVRYDVTPSPPKGTSIRSDMTLLEALSIMMAWIMDIVVGKWRLFFALSLVVGLFVLNERNIRQRQQRQQQQQQQQQRPHQD